MISRRAFVLTSLAGSASLLSGCRNAETPAPPASGAPAAAPNPPQQTRANTSLELYFVGGTAFRKIGTSFVAVQPRGKGVVYNGHPMDHRSFLVAPKGTFPKEGNPFPKGYDMAKLHPNLTLPPEDYEAVCLLARDVKLSQVNGGTQVNYRSTEVADYQALAAKYRWEPKGDWTPNADGPVCSRFAFDAGDLVNGKAVNQRGYAAAWSIGGGEAKTLSDVAILQLKAESIAIDGIGATHQVPPDKPLALYVFGGPDVFHTARPYRQISHALLLKTIYDVKDAKDEEIMPTSAKEVEGEPAGDPRHPCDFAETPAAAAQQRRVPPDTEYCVNYDGLP